VDGAGVPDANNPSTTTDANGNYTFFGLTAGTYSVHEVLPLGQSLTTPVQTVTVAANQTSSAVNFGESPLTGAGVTLTAIEVQTFAGAVATFTDADNSDTAGQFTATIDWGDGTMADSTATVTGGSGLFTVTGSHTYADPGHENLKVTILESTGPTATVNATAVIGSADQRFVSEVYRDFLGRAVEPGGLAVWSASLTAGNTRAQLVSDIETSVTGHDASHLIAMEMQCRRHSLCISSCLPGHGQEFPAAVFRVCAV